MKATQMLSRGTLAWLNRRATSRRSKSEAEERDDRHPARQLAMEGDLGARKDVRELQATIERAFALLDEAADEEGEAEALPVPWP